MCLFLNLTVIRVGFTVVIAANVLLNTFTWFRHLLNCFVLCCHFRWRCTRPKTCDVTNVGREQRAGQQGPADSACVCGTCTIMRHIYKCIALPAPELGSMLICDSSGRVANLYFKLCASLNVRIVELARAVAGCADCADCSAACRCPQGPRPGRHPAARFKMRRMTFISRLFTSHAAAWFSFTARAVDRRLWGEWGLAWWWGLGRGWRWGLGVTGRDTTRHVSTVGNGFLRRRNVCYTFLASTFVSITITCYPCSTSTSSRPLDSFVTCWQRQLCQRNFMT